MCRIEVPNKYSRFCVSDYSGFSTPFPMLNFWIFLGGPNKGVTLPSSLHISGIRDPEAFWEVKTKSNHKSRRTAGQFTFSPSINLAELFSSERHCFNLFAFFIYNYINIYNFINATRHNNVANTFKVS